MNYGILLHGDAPTVSGHTVEENCRLQETADPRVIRPLSDPLQPAGSGTAVLRGNLCPDGAVIKQSAATASLLVHRGRALVFDSVHAYNVARDDPGLGADETSVLVVRNAGPLGYPGMPEVGNLQLPRALLERGVRDMVRISDARMSGTAYGTVVLHVAPEAAVGGPLALVATGDFISLDVPSRRLNLEVSDEELARRRDNWRPGQTARRAAVTIASFASTSCRRTVAWTSISWSVGAATGSPPRPIKKASAAP